MLAGRLTPWDHLVLSCCVYSFIAMVITGWMFWHPEDATWTGYAAAMTGHLWALAGLVWARGHRW